MNIIWLGSVVREEVVDHFPAISPAGNKWQLRLIRSLVELPNVELLCLGHRLERVFPYGRLFVNDDNFNIPPSINQKQFLYPNLPFFRLLYINVILLFWMLRALYSNRNSNNVIISYNVYSYNVLPFLFGKILGIKSIIVVADPINEKSGKVNPFVKLSDGAVYLSSFLYENSKLKKKINIEGGIEEISLETVIANPFPDFNYILYTGKLTVANGLENLLEAFNLLEDKEIRLILTGFGLSTNIRSMIEGNDRVILHEMIKSKDLISYYTYAKILINPRLISSKTNDANFPSKLLEYLSFKKPIISTMTRGIPNEYRMVIEFVYSDCEIELAKKITEVLNWDETRVNQRELEISDFIRKRKSWHIVANTIKGFINEI